MFTSLWNCTLVKVILKKKKQSRQSCFPTFPSELQTVCESLEGCHLLQKVHLTGNPLQQESGWR